MLLFSDISKKMQLHLQALRHKNGIKQQFATHKLGINVGESETKETNPTLNTLVNTCNLYNVSSLSEFFFALEHPGYDFKEVLQIIEERQELKKITFEPEYNQTKQKNKNSF